MVSGDVEQATNELDELVIAHEIISVVGAVKCGMRRERNINDVTQGVGPEWNESRSCL